MTDGVAWTARGSWVPGAAKAGPPARWAAHWALVLGLAWAPTPADAHLIDEIAEALYCDLQTTDRREWTLTWFLDAGRVAATFDALAAAGQSGDGSAAAFAARLAEGFAMPGCQVAPLEPAELQLNDRPQMRAFALRARCQAPLDTLLLQRVAYDRVRTRATLYISLRVGGEADRRLLLPPRLAELEVPLRPGLATPPRKGAANDAGSGHGGRQGGRHVGHDDDEESAAVPAFRPGDPVDASRLPAPGQGVPVWRRLPPWPLLSAWAELGALHMAAGADHLLMLVALALAARRLSGLLWAVAGFSVGHMVTMAWAIAAAWPPMPWVEAAIGATLVGAGLIAARSSAADAGNLAADPLPRRALQRGGAAVGAALALACGLIHGAAFGAELRHAVGAGDGLLAPVLAFAVGLDVVQMLAAGAAFALLGAARRWLPRGHEPLRRVLGAAVAVAGLALALRALLER